MRLNYDTTITGESVKLVPYRREHVQRYHNWMKDPFLQEATASEPLSLEDEYKMQAAWADDPDKLTFILLDVAHLHGPDDVSLDGMAGDVNLFLNDPIDPRVGEIEVMVAEDRSRRKGIAEEAVQIFMAYAVKHLGLSQILAKIGDSNTASQGLFQKLGFTECGRSAVFREVSYRLHVSGPIMDDFLVRANTLKTGKYVSPAVT